MPDPVADYLAALTGGSSAMPAAPGASASSAQPGGWETVLRAALPAVAGFFAARQGQLGTFTRAYNDGTDRQRRQEQQDRQFQLEQEQANIQRKREAARIAVAAQEAQRRQTEDADQQAAADAKAKAAQDKADTEVVQKSLDEAAKNPLLNTLISTFGADSFSVKTPLGPMTLAEAQRRGAVVPGELGTKVLTLPKKERAPLVTTPGPDGNPVRTEDKPGVKVYQRPRPAKEPREPKAPKTTRYTWKDDDPASDTYGQSFRIVEDEAGNVVSKQRITAGTVAPTATSAAPAGAPKKIGRFTVEVEN